MKLLPENRALLLALCLGCNFFDLLAVDAYSLGGLAATVAKRYKFHFPGQPDTTPIPTWDGISHPPTGKKEPRAPPSENPPTPPVITNSGTNVEEVFYGRDCRVGIYQTPWFRNQGSVEGVIQYERWEGFPLRGRTGDKPESREPCWDVADLNPAMVNQTKYSVITGYCGCQFFSKRGCAPESWVYSGHDTRGPVPPSALNNVASFRCRHNNHFDDFQSCSVTITNGGDSREPGGRYNRLYNHLDGHRKQYWYQKLQFTKENIMADKGSGGSECYVPFEDGRDRFIRYFNTSGCSCTLYADDKCSDRVLAESGGYGTSVAWDFPTTPFIRPGSFRCWLPFGLNYGQRADGGPERTNWGE
ncbi:hypothetical protein TWF730_003348 [Orbilia blumenaviensis]|uniref:Uncharacterized protein n=1 Tax=Orbilia blumenaviensis TaxID=1796055 RepID=A0AAV9U5K6_9PEZI